MRIEVLSIKAVTVAIISMVGIVAIILSLFAGSYFRKAALDAQMNSLSRVIEMAAQEMLKEVRGYTFDLGMKLGHSERLAQALERADKAGGRDRLVALLDDPFVNGFVGFARVNLVKLRVYSLDLELIGESSAGMEGLESHLSEYLAGTIVKKNKTDRLKAVDALWMSSQGPLYSTLVPLGGLRPIGYLEVIIDPAFNLPDIGKVTKTPISVFSMSGAKLSADEQDGANHYLPVEFTMLMSNGEPAFRVVGYEDVDKLNKSMEQTQIVTTSGFLALTLGTLLFALWLFNRFLFVPVGRMVEDMKQIANGKLDLQVNKSGLREISVLAKSFESMADQVRMRANDLERLLDLDDSAILCFGNDAEAVYFNRGAVALFGYSDNEISDLELDDLFAEESMRLIKDAARTNSLVQNNTLTTRLSCTRKDGYVFQSEAVINTLAIRGGYGYAIVLNPIAENKDDLLTKYVVSTIEKNEQRMHAVEQSLNSMLEMARDNPGLVPGIGKLERPALPGLDTDDDKRLVREQAVNVMRSALACWERDLGKTKLDLAEESRIWPVYIDKSTPTTRTLDKYLNIDSCPKNPRTQRVIDTAEFVLRQMNKKTTVGRKKLQQVLDDFRLLISGVKSGAKRAYQPEAGPISARTH
jgi:PAS domain S-box-containing protein